MPTLPLKTFGFKVSNSLASLAEEQVREILGYDYLRQFTPLNQLALGMPVDDGTWKEVLRALGNSCGQVKISPGLSSSIKGDLFLYLMEMRAAGSQGRENILCPRATKMEIDFSQVTSLTFSTQDSLIASGQTLQTSRRTCNSRFQACVRFG